LGALFLLIALFGAGRRELAASSHCEGVMIMKHTLDEFKAKIHEMYPKIDKHGVASTVTFDKAKKTYVLELKKGPHHLATYIDKTDADKCMDGVECIHLGVQIGQFLENFKKV
jgi:hypothetical protein